MHGRLLEQGTGRPVGAADVTLIGEAGGVVDRAETDPVGRFTLRSPDPGRFYVRAERIGYRAKMDGMLELGEGGEITVDFYLTPEPVELEGIDATAEAMSVWLRRDRDYLASQGFYDRKKVGFGHFITPEDLEERQPGKGSVVMTGRGDKGGARCTPTVLVNSSPYPVFRGRDRGGGNLQRDRDHPAPVQLPGQRMWIDPDLDENLRAARIAAAAC